MPNQRADYWDSVAAAKAPPLAPRKIYCYEQCSREESLCREESAAGPLNWYLIHLPDHTIAKWLDPQEKLPKGAEYVRPVERGE